MKNDPDKASTIETPNLRLIPCEPSHLEIAMKDKKGLEPLLGVSVPNAWPVFPEAMPYAYEKLKADPASVGWWTYFFVHVEDRVLLGEGGLKGRPGDSGTVEIGYAMIPGYRGRGFATEAAGGLVGWAFSHPEVSAVVAETLPEGHPSMRVLEKIGMTLVGTTGEVLRWRLDRHDLEDEGGAL